MLIELTQRLRLRRIQRRHHLTVQLALSVFLAWLLIVTCIAASTADPMLSFQSKQSRVDKQGERYAVVIGVNQYRRFAPLDYAVTDAKRLAHQFDAQGYTVKLLENYEADPQHILDTLRSIGKLMDAGTGRHNGTLVLTYSGHGFRQDGQNYLAMGHADPGNLQRTALSIKRIKKVLSQSGIARRMLFIDACRNDPGKSIPGPQHNFLLDEDADGVAILYSTGAGRLSWEDSDLAQGVFSYYLSEGLAGAAVNNQKLITFDGLYRYVRRQVSDHVFTKYDRRQIPYIAGERSGDFVLARVNPEAIPLVSIPEKIKPLNLELPRVPSAKKNNGVPDSPVNDNLPDKPIVATSARYKGWKKAATIFGAIMIGAVVAKAASSSNTSTSETSVTLVVPTP